VEKQSAGTREGERAWPTRTGNSAGASIQLTARRLVRVSIGPSPRAPAVSAARGAADAFSRDAVAVSFPTEPSVALVAEADSLLLDPV
jgi:hypothetical protein